MSEYRECELTDHQYGEGGRCTQCGSVRRIVEAVAERLGAKIFAALCERLIGAGNKYLYPEIVRTSESGWEAKIIKHHDGSEVLAYGQSNVMDEALYLCAEAYMEEELRENRRRSLVTKPEVAEALALFGVDLAEWGQSRG